MHVNNCVRMSPKARRLTIAMVISGALIGLLIGAGRASAGSGAVGPSVASGATGTSAENSTPPKYDRLWAKVATEDRRWARQTSECESGRDPDAVALGGRYLGAFMFTPDAWATSPKTPGGRPIDYSYRTQAVVAVALMHRDGTRPWPVCG